MSDILSETTLSLAQAANTLPPARSGKRCHISTVLRWIERGVKGPDGATVRLEGVRLGARWITSREALTRFTERLTPDLDDQPALPPRTPGQRRRASEAAAEELNRMGV